MTTPCQAANFRVLNVPALGWVISVEPPVAPAGASRADPRSRPVVFTQPGTGHAALRRSARPLLAKVDPGLILGSRWGSGWGSGWGFRALSPDMPRTRIEFCDAPPAPA